MINLNDSAADTATNENTLVRLAKDADISHAVNIVTITKRVLRSKVSSWFTRSMREAYDTADTLESQLYSNKLFIEKEDEELYVDKSRIVQFRKLLTAMMAVLAPSLKAYKAKSLSVKKAEELNRHAEMYNMAETSFIKLFGEEWLKPTSTK